MDRRLRHPRHLLPALPSGTGARWAWAYLGFLFLILPSVYLPFTLDPALYPRLALVSLIHAAFLLASPFPLYTGTREREGMPRLVRLLLLVFILAVMLSVAFAGHRMEALKAAARLLNIILAFWIIYSVFLRYPVMIRNLAVILAFSNLIHLFIGLWQLLPLMASMQLDHQGTYLVTGLSAHRNLFSELLFLTASGWALWKPSFRAGSYIRLGMLLLNALVILLVMTKAVWLAILVTLLVYGMLSIPGGVGTARGWLRALLMVGLAGLLIAAVVFAYDMAYQNQAFSCQLDFLRNYRFGSSLERIRLWEGTWSLFAGEPLTGLGPGNWKILFPCTGLSGLRAGEGVIFFQRPHNDFLWMLSETGILGFLPWLALWVLPFFQLRRMLKKKALRGQNAMLLAWISGSAVISLLSFPLERIENAALQMMLLAVSLAWSGRAVEGPVYPGLMPVVRTILAAVLLASGWMFISNLESEVYGRQLLIARDQGRPAEVIRLADLADGPFHAMDPTSTPWAWYKGSAEFNLGMADQAVVSFLKAYHVNPCHLHVMNNLGSALVAAGREEEAIPYYRKALHVSPGFAEPAKNLAAVFYNQGRLHEAMEVVCDYPSIRDLPQGSDYILAILKANIEVAKAGESDSLIISTMQRINLIPEWTMDVYDKAVENQKDFVRQLEEEAIYILESLDSLITPAQADSLRNR